MYNRQKWNWQAYWQVSYKPRPDWNFEVSGYYTTSLLNEFVYVQEIGSLNITIQKSVGILQCQIIDLSFRRFSESRNLRQAG